MKYDREYKELEDKYNALQAEFEQYKRESVKWSVEDFTDYDTDGEYTITEEKAQEALEHMIDKHDASIGITWDTVDCYLKEYATSNDEYDGYTNEDSDQ